MNLSIVYCVFIYFLLLLITDSTRLINQCPTSRRLLLFDKFKLPFGEKKSSRHSSSKRSSSSKSVRSSDSHGLTVLIQPQTSQELGHKVRSYTHLLKPKLFTTEEKIQLKKLKKSEKKRQIKKKNSTTNMKNKELIPINEEEINRCRAILHINSVPTTTTTTTIGVGDEKKTKKVKRDLPIKEQISTKIKDVTNQQAKNVTNKVENIPPISPVNDKKVKPTKKTSKAESEVKKPTKFSSSLPSVDKTSSKYPSPPTQSTPNLKLKRSKPETITIIEQITSPLDSNEDDIDDKNHSVVNRAFYFVKNMFQLSDNSPEENSIEEDQIIDISNEQQTRQHHHSRKLLSIDEDISASFHLRNVPKRRLLTTKTKTTSTKKKEKKPKLVYHTDAKKPKVGWAYRYRISRYLAAQKMKRTVASKHRETKKTKKSNPSTNTKVSKRKLLQLDFEEDYDSDLDTNDISDQNIVETMSIMTNFVPKRQLLASKTKLKTDVHEDKTQQKRKEKLKKSYDTLSFDELTDPVAIVRSYDQRLYKPHVGWQFRYRVSRYIDSLRENIREDQERLKLGLQAIKRQTPQEITGRRKRVVDKPISSKSEQKETVINDNKPNAGWRYRYRISKMNDAKKRGEVIDDENEKQKTVFDQKKKKSVDQSKSTVINEPIQDDIDLDPELAKINEEGRKVGWAYRYRIRRKLDHFKQIQAETGVPFDLATLSGKREKKVKPTPKKKNESIVEKSSEKNKSVGWQYRYRVSKMHEAQKQNKSKPITSKKQEDKPVAPKKLPPPEERTAGWEHRYRIRRKLDSLQDTSSANQSGKRTKKSSIAKKKNKISKVKESNEENVNSDQTPVAEFFSSLLPAAKKTLCIVPFSFCDSVNNQSVEPKKRKRIKKLRTKKEYRAKQFIRGHRTKLGAEDKATERRVDEQMKRLYRRPSYPPLQVPPSPPSSNSDNISKKDHSNQHVEKVIVVDSKKNQNKKQYQIISQEKKIKPKGLSPPSKLTNPSKTVTTTTTITITTTTVTNVPTTTASAPLRTLSELIHEEAATILATKRKESQTPEEIKYEINETKEVVQEQVKLQARTPPTTTTTPSSAPNNPTSGEQNKEFTSSNDKNNNDNKNDEENTINLN